MLNSMCRTYPCSALSNPIDIKITCLIAKKYTQLQKMQFNKTDISV